MMRAPWVLAIALLPTFPSCDPTNPPQASGTSTAMGLPFAGLHGGRLVELGDHSGFLEFVHDEDARTLVIHSLGVNARAPRVLPGSPVVKLTTEEGPVALESTVLDETRSTFRVVHDALRSESVHGRVAFCTGETDHQVDFDSPLHGHGGVRTALFDESSPDERIGFAELKLHDDAGNLELFLQRDLRLTEPLDVPLDASVDLVFPTHEERVVTLRPRDSKTNPNERGDSMLREGRTNYFIFPTQGEDARWLRGTGFRARVFLKITSNGRTLVTRTFGLRPHF